MQATEGVTIQFEDYLKRAARPRAHPVIWRAGSLLGRVDGAQVNERGTVALIDPTAKDDVTIAPGLSCAVQVVPPATHTRYHAHSFWHLCLVRCGRGRASFEDDGSADALTEGDILFIPAWCSHSFTNCAEDAPLIMLVIQNLPSIAAAGTLARYEDDQPVRIVYAD